MKKKYLGYYDYGQGAVWCYLIADSKEDIARMYPEITIVDNPPHWLNAEREKNLNEKLTYDLSEEPTGLLEGILRDRAINQP